MAATNNNSSPQVGGELGMGAIEQHLDGGHVKLHRNKAGNGHVVAQGIIANGPLLCMGAVLTSAAIYAQGALPLAYLLGAVLVWLWVNTPMQYSKKLASSGGMFYYVSRGVGTYLGFLAGLCYALYYTAFLAGGAVYFSVMVQSMLVQFGMRSVPEWLWVPLILAIIVPPAVLVYRGVLPSLRYGIIAGLIEILLMLITSIVIVVLAGHSNTTSVFTPTYARGGISGIGVGLLLAAFGMSGSTATIFLGHEAKLPHRAVRRGLVLSTAAVAVIMVFVAYALTIGWGPAHMGTFANSSIPGLLVIHKFMGTGMELLVAVFMANSIVSAIIASTLVVSRVTHVMSVAGLFPKSFRDVDPRSGTPRVAVLACLGTAAAGAIGAGVIWGPVTAFTVLILVATMGEFVGHILGNLALPFFAHSRQVVRVVVHIVLPMLSLVTIGIGIFYTFFPVVVPLIWGPVVFLIGLAIGTVFYVSKRISMDTEGRAALKVLIAKLGLDTDDGAAPSLDKPALVYSDSVKG
ncbi:MAG: APC family permease [Actinobacteria bacterium]|jgi:amino acid transporter|nr:APC family permease [Actinomycetota bacterium]MCL6095680.1 APC family permease [Actinomycetota bacterium]